MTGNLLIFRIDSGLLDSKIEECRYSIASQLDKGNVVVLPSYVELVDVCEIDGDIKIGYK